MSTRNPTDSIKRTPRRLPLGDGIPWDEATELLRESKLRARHNGNLTDAVISGGYYAKKHRETMYLYSGNSYGVAVWRVSMKPSNYLCPTGNTGAIVISVTPELLVSKHPCR